MFGDPNETIPGKSMCRAFIWVGLVWQYTNRWILRGGIEFSRVTLILWFFSLFLSIDGFIFGVKSLGSVKVCQILRSAFTLDTKRGISFELCISAI